MENQNENLEVNSTNLEKSFKAAHDFSCQTGPATTLIDIEIVSKCSFEQEDSLKLLVSFEIIINRWPIGWDVCHQLVWVH